MKVDISRGVVDEGKRSPHTFERLSSGEQPAQAGPPSARFSSREPADQGKWTTSDVSGGWREVEPAPRGAPVLPARLRRLGYYALALLFVAIAALLRWALSDVLGPTPFLIFYLAWVGAAAFGGLGPGLLATIVSWVCVDFLFDPALGHIGLDSPTSLARLSVFLAGGLVVSVVGEKMRQSRIRERRQTRELAAINVALRESEECLRRRAEEVETLMDLIPAAIWVAYDPQCNQIIGNRTANRFYEAREQENVSANVSALRRFFQNGQELTPQELPMQAAAARNTDVRNSEVDVLLPSGIRRNLLGSASPLRDAEGRVRGCIGAFMDITARKQVEETLRESEEKYRRIVVTATEAIVLTDAEARTVFANARWSEIFGYSLEEARQMTHFDLVFPEDLAAMKARWEARKHGQKETYEFRLRRKDGRPVWVLIGVTPSLSPEGEFLGTLVMLTDITERKRAEDALRELTATLESKVAQRTAELEHRAWQLQKLTLELTEAEERERKRLAEILHDDLQQVLAAAKFHIGLLSRRGKDDTECGEIARQANELLADAIAKSRSLSHELCSPALSRTDLGEMFEWLSEQMQIQHGLTVHLETRERIEMASAPLRILLYKAAQELLFNVIKHAGVCEAKLRLRRQGGRIRLSVSDRGRGFDPAGSAHSLGYGLPSLRERVDLLGGRTRIRSAVGKGSTFLITVPDGESTS